MPNTHVAWQRCGMEALAVVINRPESLSVCRLPLTPPGDDDVVVDIAWSGISTGTERLLWQGRMPPFPGMGIRWFPDTNPSATSLLPVRATQIASAK